MFTMKPTTTMRNITKNMSASKPLLPLLTTFFVAVLVVMLLLLLAESTTVSRHGTTPTLFFFAEAADLTGDPITVASIGGFSNVVRGELQSTALLAMNLSFNLQNAAGGIRGRPLRVVTRDNDEVASRIPALIDDLIANVSNVTLFANILGEPATAATYSKLVEYNMVLIQPNAGTRRWYKFDRHIVHVLPSPDAEIFAQMSYIVKQYQFTRIGFISDIAQDYGTELLPTVQAFAASIGASVVSHLKLNYTKSTVSVDIPELTQMIVAKPHVILNWGSLYAANGVALTTLLLQLPDLVVLCSVGQLPIVDAVVRLLPAASVGSRVLFTNVGPSYTDTSYQLTRKLRDSISGASPQPILNLTYLDVNPGLGMMAYLGFAVGELLGTIFNKMDVVNSTTVQDAIFQTSIYEVGDLIFGPFSGECPPGRTIYCKCNNGARKVDVVVITAALELKTVAGASLTLPLSTCTAENLTLASPLVAATVWHPTTPGAASATTDYLIGRNAAVSPDTTIDGVTIQYAYSGNSTAALQTLNTEKLLTASAGSVLNLPIGDATGIGAVIDPMEVRPRLYGGFRRDVVYVSPTYEQELHALASLAVAQGKGITVLSALEEDGSAVGSTLTRSMNTLGKEGGGHRSSTSIASGLLATGDGGVTILHGIATSADIAAITTHLGQQPNAVVAIPMAHLLVWYRELVATVTDEGQRSRIVFATSLPNWAGPVSGETTGPALQTYLDRVPATNRTPATLRGYMTHQLLTYVTGRIPGLKSPTEFLRMLYGASVVVMDTGLVAGPYFDATCASSSSTSDPCEMNIGARVVRVRTLATTTNASNAARAALSITLDSGRIAYYPLPGPVSSITTIIIIVAVVGGLLLVGLVVAVVLVCVCSGRSNWTAPKDEKDPFTIIFTDIQSSTTLWAEAPEAMAPALDHHHALIRKLCNKHRGYEVKTIGDAFMVAFRDAVDAVELSAALQFDFFNDMTWSQQIDHVYLEMDQQVTQDMKALEKAMYSIALSQEDYGKVWNGLRVRIGIHTGFGEIKKDPVSHGYDYYGTVVNTAARTESIAHGGQVIMTEAALAASGISEDRVVPMGAVMLRGVPEPIHVYQLTTIAKRIFPPLRVESEVEAEEGAAVVSGDSASNSNYSFSQSTLGRLSLQKAARDTIQRQINAVLKTLISVHPVGPRGKFLMDTCRRWQLDVPNSEDAFVTSPDVLDKLSAKIAPIMARRKEFAGIVGRGGIDRRRGTTDEASVCSSKATGGSGFLPYTGVVGETTTTAPSSTTKLFLDPPVLSGGGGGQQPHHNQVLGNISPAALSGEEEGCVFEELQPHAPPPSNQYN